MQPVIVLFGKNGQVGFELNKHLRNIGKVSVFDSKEADFTKMDSVISILEKIKPDIIVNAVAHTAVDKAESEEELAYSINVEAPAKIAQFAKQNGCLLVHYSTDFVFDGERENENAKAYLETDITNPLSVYGSTKLQGEQAIIASDCVHLIFRTSWVYGLRGSNFLLTMLRLADEREEMKIVKDQLGSPVWCGHIAYTTAEVLKNLLNEHTLSQIPNSVQGVYNLTASNHTSWFKFAKKILELDPNHSQQRCKSLLGIPAIEYPTPAVRPKWSVLDNTKIIKQFEVEIPSWESQLTSCFKNK